MNPIIVKIFTSYLLFPIIAFLMGFIVMLVAKKNKLLQDKKAIFYILLSGVLISTLGVLGLLGVNFMPYGYLTTQALYLFLGFFNLRLLFRFVKSLENRSFGYACLFMFVQIIIGWALFSVWFNLTNDFQYGIWAGSSVFAIIVVPLFSESFNIYLKIPVEIYKMRIYDGFERIPQILQSTPINPDELLVFEIEIYKHPNDSKPIRLKAKAKDDIIFGDWYELIVSDYNKKKYLDPIEYYNIENPYGWIFYVKPSFFLPRGYIDPELSFTENKLRERDLVVAKRVQKD